MFTLRYICTVPTAVPVHLIRTAWAFVENATFYVYYLVIEHSLGEGFGLATSTDGCHTGAITGWSSHVQVGSSTSGDAGAAQCGGGT